MKILYVITKSNWGGAQRHVYDLATAMKQKDHEVWVALGGDGVLKQKLEQAGIYTFSIMDMKRDISIKSDSGSFKEIYRIIKNKRPDIVHLHSPKAAGLGALAARLLRVKKILTTVHGWTFNESRPWYQKGAITFFLWLTVVLAHKTIILGEREYAQAMYFPLVKDKFTIIPLGIKKPTFVSVDGAKQAIAKGIGMELSEYSKKTVIGTIAELHPNKGLSYLIDALATVRDQQPNTITVIVGDGQDKAALHMQIKERKLEQNVYLFGYLDMASEYLKAFSIFVLPSIKEGLPYTILEAGSAGLPVVATAVGGIPEIIEDMKSGILIQSKNARELSHALTFMIEHPDERKKYGNALKERVATKFSLEKMITSVVALYTPSTHTQIDIVTAAPETHSS